MLTQCEQCKKTYSISVDALSQKRSELLCPHCEEMLGRLKRFGNDFLEIGGKKKRHPKFILWGIGAVLCLFLLAGQIYFFEKDNLSQNPKARGWLQKICLSLSCELPAYRNLNDFEVMYGEFQLSPENYYIFKAVISNQAKFAQHYPHIQLNLSTFSGENFAQRVFTPKDYLNSEANKLIPASKAIEISLKIAVPKQKVGGYTFELI
ncbi:MAG: DUF3426 domain-containing protein [Methylococcaceae bacterium]|nr:DUF3426 domain-containing protein [Methylococcaceae bacterium]